MPHELLQVDPFEVTVYFRHRDGWLGRMDMTDGWRLHRCDEDAINPSAACPAKRCSGLFFDSIDELRAVGRRRCLEELEDLPARTQRILSIIDAGR